MTVYCNARRDILSNSLILRNTPSYFTNSLGGNSAIGSIHNGIHTLDWYCLASC